jgi:hypothetical protein
LLQLNSLKKTLVHKVTNQKPKSRSVTKKKRESGLSKLSEILDNQLSFDDIEPKPSKFSSFISKINP